MPAGGPTHARAAMLPIRPLVPRLLAVALLALAFPSGARAQRLPPAAAATRASVALAPARAARASVRPRRDPEERFAIRFVAALPLSAVVGIAGAYVGSNMEGDCQCDDPGLAGALYGVTAGATVGAALGAAMPPGDSRCSYGTRFLAALGGAAVGTIGGIVLASKADDLGPAAYALLAMPSIGAAIPHPMCGGTRRG